MSINLKVLTVQEMFDLKYDIDRELDLRKEEELKVNAILDKFDFYTVRTIFLNKGWSWGTGIAPTVTEMESHCRQLLLSALRDEESPTWWESGRFLVTKDGDELSLFFAPIANRGY